MAHLCPSCSKEFKSEHGVRIHHVQIHGKSLLESNCQICGKPMRKYREDHNFCSRECAGQHFSVLYNQNATAVCTICSKKFSIRPSRLKQHHNFCSRSCMSQWLRRNQRLLNCEICGQEISCAPYDKRRRFCSKKCEATWKSFAYKGKGKGFLIYTCGQCGKEFPDTYYTGERKFCSKKCAVEALKVRTSRYHLYEG